MLSKIITGNFEISSLIDRTRIVAIVSIAFLWSCKSSEHDSQTGDPKSEESRDKSPNNRNPLMSIKGLRVTLNNFDDPLKRLGFYENNVHSMLGSLSAEDLKQLIESLDYEHSEGDSLILGRAFEELAAKDPKLALDMATKLPSNRCEQVGINIFSVLAKEKPKDLSEWILANEWGDRNSRWLSIFSVGELAKVRPGDAVDLLANCDPNRKGRLAYPILMELAKTNVDEAVQTLQTLSLGKEQKDVMAAIFISYGPVDPAKAFAGVSKLDQDYVKSKALPPIFTEWMGKDPQAAGASLSTLPSSLVQEILKNKNNLTKLVDAGPNLAIDALNQMVFTEANASIFMQAASALGTKDPVAAAAWIQEFPDGPKKGDLVKEVAIARASQNPEESVPRILAEQGPYRNFNIEGAGNAWGKADPAQALQYLPNLSSGEQAIYASAVMKASLAENPAATANLISSSDLPAAVVGSGDYQGIVRSAGDFLASQDIDEGIKWASALPASEGVAAFGGVASRYAEKDVMAAAEWVKQLPEGDKRNAAIQALVRQIEKTDPKAANEWKSQIQ